MPVPPPPKSRSQIAQERRLAAIARRRSRAPERMPAPEPEAIEEPPPQTRTPRPRLTDAQQATAAALESLADAHRRNGATLDAIHATLQRIEGILQQQQEQPTAE